MPYYDEELNGYKTEIINVYKQQESNIKEDTVILCVDFNVVYNLLDHYQYKEEIETWIEVDS